MCARNSRKRKLSYDDEASKFSVKPLREDKSAGENVVREEWKRRMESFETSSSVSKKMFPVQAKIPASLVATRFIDSGSEVKPSQGSEVDIDWLPSSDEEELHIYEMQKTASRNRMHAADKSSTMHDELTSDIEIISSPALRNCKPIIDYDGPALRHGPIVDSGPVILPSADTGNGPAMGNDEVLGSSPVIQYSPVIEFSPILRHSSGIENSPVVRHSPVIEYSPVIQCSPVTKYSPILRRSPIIDYSPVIRRSPTIENSPVIRRGPVVRHGQASPVIHSQRRNHLQVSSSNLGSPTDSSYDGDGIESVSGRQDDSLFQFSRSQVPISQYESQENKNSSDDDGGNEEEDEYADETVSISSLPGSQLESNPGQLVPVPVSSSKSKDFIEGLQRYFLTPEKNLQTEDDATAAKSTTKKKQKFVKGAFADRLNKLVTRQRTTAACWLHKNQRASGNAVSDRVLVCDVTSCVTDHGHLVAKCRVTRGSTSDASPPKKSLVLFSQEAAQRCNIKSGSVLKIYPPWQSLKLDNNWEVVLNTDLCQVESQEGELRVDGQEVEETLGFDTVLASWTCPCSLDPCSCSAVCRQNLGSVSKSSVFRCSSAGSCITRSSGLTSDGVAVAVETCCLSTIVPLSQETLLSSSILESIEQKGGSVAMEIDFYATIQRVFCRVAQRSSNDSWSDDNGVSFETGSWVQWSLLVQDLYGFLCEVILPRNLDPISCWRKVTTAALGSQWAFYNLQVGRRLTRPKFGRLFGIIDSVWKLDSSSAVSPEDSASSHHKTCAPSFCYALHAAHVGASCRLWSHTTARSFSPRSFRLLASIALDVTSGRDRVSFGARLLCSRELELVQHFYVTDCSLQDETSIPYVIVVVSNAVVVSTDCSRRLPIVFHEVHLESGQFLADEYSRVMVDHDSHWLSLMDLSPRLPLLAIDSGLHSLVIVSGCVTDVDQETASAWSVCDLCENSELGTSLQNSFLYCHDCKRPITTPLTKMKLDICLAVPTLPDVVVKVKALPTQANRKQVVLSSRWNWNREHLLQNTIEMLLPSIEYDEGYDIEQVLGQQVIQLTCLITAVTKIGHRITEFDVDEISFSLP